MPARSDSLNMPYDYILEAIVIPDLTDILLAKHSGGLVSSLDGYADVQPQAIAVNEGSFTSSSRVIYFPTVVVKQTEQSLFLSCECNVPKDKLCEHQVQVLLSLIRRKELRIFFDQPLRQAAIKQVAKDYGLENEVLLDEFFQVDYENKSIVIRPKQQELISLTQADKDYFTTHLLPKDNQPDSIREELAPNQKQIIVFTKHRYYDHFCLELFEAATAKDGRIKNPLTAIQPFDLLTKVDNLNEVKFYSTVAKFQNHHRTKKEDTDLSGLRFVAGNPLKLAVFYHSSSVSENITSHSLVPINLKILKGKLKLSVKRTGNFYDVWGSLTVDGTSYELHKLSLKYDYFILLNDTLHLVDNTDYLRVIQFFNKKNNKIIIHQSKYEEFQQTILAKLEDQIQIDYAYLKPATPDQLAENGFNQERERIIYLSDSENYVLLTPVMKYGTAEVPILSKRQIHSVDAKGKPFTVSRDEEAENQFMMALVSQHPDFQDQTNHIFFSLHKKHVLDEGWFLDAFDTWTSQNIRILGFNTLKNNKLNQNKGKVSVIVSSGLNWFETSLGLSYGKQQVSLKNLHKAVKNKSRFVTLDDGTSGLLPAEWLERFSAYFQAGDVVEERIRTPKISFQTSATYTPKRN